MFDSEIADGGGSRSATWSRREALRLGLAGLATTALIGCGASGGSAPSTMRFGAENYSGARLQALMRKPFVPTAIDVSRRHAASWSESVNAHVELLFEDDWRERAMRTAESGTGADIAELFGNATHLLADRLVDQTAAADAIGDRLGGWMDLVRQAVVVDGVWRAIPWSYTTQAINYRADLLAEIGSDAPATYDDLLEIATRLHDAALPRVGFTMNPNGPNDASSLAYSMLWSFGGAEVDESGTRVVLDSAATRDALAFFAALHEVSDPSAQTFDEGGNNAAFLDGSISMTQNASSIYWKAQTEAPDIAAAMNHVRYPAGPAGHHQLVELNSLGIFSHSPNIDAARGWVRASTDAAHLSQRAAESLAFFSPPLLGFDDDPTMPWNADPKLADVKLAPDSAHLPGWPGRATQESGLVYENQTILRMFAAVASGEMSVNEAVSTATEELRLVYET